MIIPVSKLFRNVSYIKNAICRNPFSLHFIFSLHGICNIRHISLSCDIIWSMNIEICQASPGYLHMFLNISISFTAIMQNFPVNRKKYIFFLSSPFPQLLKCFPLPWLLHLFHANYKQNIITIFLIVLSPIIIFCLWCPHMKTAFCRFLKTFSCLWFPNKNSREIIADLWHTRLIKSNSFCSVLSAFLSSLLRITLRMNLSFICYLIKNR